MRAVAGSLGTSAGSLYRYLSSRADLLDLMVDRVVGELRPYPASDGDWLDGMLLLGRGQLGLHRQHPWLLGVLHQVSGAGPETLAWFDACLRILEPVSCAVTTKFEAIAMMTGLVSLLARGQATPSITFADVDLAPYPHLARAFSTLPGPVPPTELFDRSLRSLLTGLLVPQAAS